MMAPVEDPRAGGWAVPGAAGDRQVTDAATPVDAAAPVDVSRAALEQINREISKFLIEFPA